MSRYAVSPWPQTSGSVETAASTLRCSAVHDRASAATVALAPSTRPSVSCVRNGDAGRTLTLSSMCASAGAAARGERQRRRAQRRVRLDAELADAFLLVRRSAGRRWPRSTSDRPGPSLRLEADRPGAAGRVVEHADADDELVARRRHRRHVGRQDEVALHLGGGFRHAHAPRARGDRDDAQPAVEVVGHRVAEVAAAGADVDDARTSRPPAACACG